MSVTLRWFPNSWFEIVSGDEVIHVDPALLPGRTESLPANLHPADLVLVTHHHPDHCDPVAVSAISTEGTTVIATSLAAEKLESVTRVVRPGDQFDIGDVAVRVVDAYNTPEGSSTTKSHIKGECVGYVFLVDGRYIYHAGDTDLVPEMYGLGQIDVALLPVGGQYTMDAAEAARAALVIARGDARLLAVPMHVRDADPHAFASVLEGTNVEVEILRPGEPIVT
jgi:L-ascorbate metabolism protein UlaG (beta-lactamase superfamily)